MNTNKQRIYADGIESITFAEALVRMDLFCIGEKQAKSYKRDITAQLLLSPEGFLRAYEAMGELLKKMEKGGVIKRRIEQTEAAAIPPPSSSPSPSSNSSPNFS